MDKGKTRKLLENEAGAVISQSENRYVIALNEKLVNTQQVNTLAQLLKHFVSRLEGKMAEKGMAQKTGNVPQVVLDFAQVDNMSAAAIGELLQFKKRMSALRGMVGLAAPNADLAAVLEVTRINQVMTTGDSVDNVFKMFSSHRRDVV